MIPETKLDSFPEGQFLILGYSPTYCFDRNCRGGDIMQYVREDIPSKLLSIENQPIEGSCTEINLRKKEWLLRGTYNPHRKNIDNHFVVLIFIHIKNSIIGDFNIEADNKEMSSFVTPLTLLVS